MTDYQGNSKRSKEPKDQTEEPKKLEKVVVGEVVVKPPTLGSKFKNVFFGGDFHTASEYVVTQVLLPALRNLIVESISRGTDRLIYGDSGPRSRPVVPQQYRPRVEYHNPAAIRQGAGGVTYLPNQTPRWSATPGNKTVQDITLGTKDDAERVVDALIAVVDQYQIVSVADLYELVGLPSAHVDHKFGWTNLATIAINQTRDGWVISFPPVEEIQ